MFLTYYQKFMSGDQMFLNYLRESLYRHEKRDWIRISTTYNALHGDYGIVYHDKVYRNR